MLFSDTPPRNILGADPWSRLLGTHINLRSRDPSLRENPIVAPHLGDRF
jgi:hypothetical protein